VLAVQQQYATAEQQADAADIMSFMHDRTACQTLRILSFLSTALPGPAYHCRPGHATATLAWPVHWWQNIFFDAGRQVGLGPASSLGPAMPRAVPSPSHSAAASHLQLIEGQQRACACM
jgi:hypothetical protein